MQAVSPQQQAQQAGGPPPQGGTTIAPGPAINAPSQLAPQLAQQLAQLEDLAQVSSTHAARAHTNICAHACVRACPVDAPDMKTQKERSCF